MRLNIEVLVCLLLAENVPSFQYNFLRRLSSLHWISAFTQNEPDICVEICGFSAVSLICLSLHQRDTVSIGQLRNMLIIRPIALVLLLFYNFIKTIFVFLVPLLAYMHFRITLPMQTNILLGC